MTFLKKEFYRVSEHNLRIGAEIFEYSQKTFKKAKFQNFHLFEDYNCFLEKLGLAN